MVSLKELKLFSPKRPFGMSFLLVPLSSLRFHYLSSHADSFGLIYSVSKSKRPTNEQG